MKRIIHTLTRLLIDTTDPTPAHGDPDEQRAAKHFLERGADR